jgi:hypothetical protein
MEFITAEIATELGLTTETIEKIKPLYDGHIATLKKDWDGVANTNAEKIIDGAVTKIAEVTKVTRNQGEKSADYIVRAGNQYYADLKSTLEAAKLEYDNKVKEFQGDAATKAELEKARQDLDDAKKLLADYDVLKDKAEKYEPLQNEYLSMKLNVAYSNVKPSFPQEVNPYEAKAKWDEFVRTTNEKWNVELVDGEAIAIDKDNEHKRVKLSELVAADKTIAELVAGRQQKGSGAKPKDKTIDGVPFAVPEEATSEEISKLIHEHLASKGIDKLSKAFSSEFAKLHAAIKAAK